MVQESTRGDLPHLAGPEEKGGVHAAGARVPRRVWSGTALLVLGRVWGSLCTLVVLWRLAHELPPAAFGRFTFYVAVFALLDSLADLGTGQVAVQRSAGDPASVARVLAATRRIRLGAGSLGVLLVGAVAFLYREPGAGWILLASLYPLTHVLELSATVYKNAISWRVPVLARAAASTLSLAFVFLLLALGVREPAPLLCGVAAGSAIANVLLHLAARRHLPQGAFLLEPPVAGLFAQALPLGLAGLCQQAYFYVDNLFVRALRGAEELGRYNVGVRFLSLSIMAAVYLSLAALPWFAREHRAGRLGAAVGRLARPLFALAGLGAGLAAPFSAEILSLFGPEFPAAAPSLRWLFAAGAVVYAGAPLTTALVATGASRAMLGVAAGGLFVNLAGNAALVPSLGAEGAAIATLATECSVVLAALFALARRGARPVESLAATLAWLGGPAGLLLGWLASTAVRG